MEAQGELDLDDENCIPDISALLQCTATCSTCYTKIYYRILIDLASFYYITSSWLASDTPEQMLAFG